jgi:hypothetical protein
MTENLERQIEDALAVYPSANFERRVMQRIAALPESRPAWRLHFVIASLSVAVAVIVSVILVKPSAHIRTVGVTPQSPKSQAEESKQPERRVNRKRVSPEVAAFHTLVQVAAEGRIELPKPSDVITEIQPIVQPDPVAIEPIAPFEQIISPIVIEPLRIVAQERENQ